MAEELHTKNAVPLIDSKSLVTTSKGWDIRLFRDEHLARRFLCALCHNVCREAHELSCSNAHLFCKQCIIEYSNNSHISDITTCPIDHEINVTYQLSKFVARHIKELYTYCPRSKVICSKLMKNARFNNNTLFCNFQGTLQNLVEHTNHQCIFNVIACPFHLLGCPTNKMYRYELQKHVNNAQNKHISLSLQKIQKLQHSLNQKKDSNEMHDQQIITKDGNIDELKFENEKLKMNNDQLLNKYNRLTEEMKIANKRINSYSEAVQLLKANNSKLAEEIDELNENSKQETVNNKYIEINNKLSTVEQQCDEYKNELIETKIANNNLQKMLKELRKKDELLVQHVIEIKKEGNKYQDECKEMMMKYNILKQKYDKQQKLLINKHYTEWNCYDIIEWIGTLDNGRYKKYESKIAISIQHEKITGKDLMDIDKSDLHRLGIVEFSDKKRILNHIKNLSDNNQNNNNNDNDNEGVDVTAFL